LLSIPIDPGDIGNAKELDMRDFVARMPVIEWPTLAIAVLIYAGWIALTAFHAQVPLPVLVVLGGWLVAWQGSLQHETIHGHPTGVGRIDSAIGFAPLSLWLPYRLYRRSHLAHHGAKVITDPRHDPESRYRLSRHGALAASLQSTLVGQMIFGPALSISRFLITEARRAVRSPATVAQDWTPHLIGVAAVLWWLDHVGMNLATYLIAFVYPGTALTMLRSYAEHRADLASPGRAAIVERGGLFAVLFLNNNLHAAHHERPRLPWYRLPSYHYSHRDHFVEQGAPIYRGYGEIIWRFAFRSHDDMLHPDHRARSA
jgi:fatty acid desaturase